MSVRKFARILGIRFGEIGISSINQLQRTLNWNEEANPGPSFRAEGFRTKSDCFATAYECARYVESMIRRGEEPSPPLYGIAGRPKLLPVSRHLNKVFEGRSLGRGVMMADAHEPILASMFTQNWLNWCKKTQNVLMLGFNKFSRDVVKVTSQLEDMNLFLNLDYSQYDSTQRNELIRWAFNLIAYGCGVKPQSYEWDLLQWLYRQFVHTYLVLDDGKIVQKHGGMPSGTGFTGLVGTIINGMVIHQTIENLKGEYPEIKKYKVFVYGDDSLIGLRVERLRGSTLYHYGQLIAQSISERMDYQYGLKVDPTATRISTELFVSSAVPNVPFSIRDGSSRVLRSYFSELRRKLGRPLRFSDKWILIDEEPQGEAVGYNTHRWSYIFHRSPKFLSYYFRKDGTMIRPTFEVMTRLINPENSVPNLKRHRDLLLSALIENVNNAHTRNHIMHWMYDCDFLENAGLMTRSVVSAEVTASWNRPDWTELSDRGELPFKEQRDVRAWYRRQIDSANLEEDWRSRYFMSRFKKIVERVRRCYASGEFGNPNYWRERNRYRRSAKILISRVRDEYSSHDLHREWLVMKSLCDPGARWGERLRVYTKAKDEAVRKEIVLDIVHGRKLRRTWALQKDGTILHVDDDGWNRPDSEIVGAIPTKRMRTK